MISGNALIALQLYCLKNGLIQNWPVRSSPQHQTMRSTYRGMFVENSNARRKNRSRSTISNRRADIEHISLVSSYRDFSAWFAPINVSLADPAGKYHNREGGVKGAIAKAVDQAEKFHRKLLDTYYHPNTYGYYGADPNQRSFGTFRWVTSAPDSQKPEVRALLPAGCGKPNPARKGAA